MLFLFVFLSTELPVPALGDLAEVTLLAQRLHRNSNPVKLNLTYTDICNLDTIEVNLVPEKKGIFLKHVEYQVISKVRGNAKEKKRRKIQHFPFVLVSEVQFNGLQAVQ